MVYVPTLDAYLIKRGRRRQQGMQGRRQRLGVSALKTSGGAGVPSTVNVDVRQYENVYNRWLFAPSLRASSISPIG